MSAHPHHGKRSEWISCEVKPDAIGAYEGRWCENGSSIFQCWYIAGAWYVMGVYHLVWSSMNQYPTRYKWRGLAEKPE